jgi:hypothetical protein
MKKTQRLTIEIQQREVVIAISHPAVEPHEERQPESDVAVTPCEMCGSDWVQVAVQGCPDTLGSDNHIHRALEQAGMHLHVSANGELRICRKSLEDLKEKR